MDIITVRAQVARKTESGNQKFAREHGLRLGGRFTLQQLAQGSRRHSNGCDHRLYPLIDHSRYYGKPVRPCCILSHSYAQAAEVPRIAAARLPPGLAVGLLPGESWYFHRCIPLVICRVEDRGSFDAEWLH